MKRIGELQLHLIHFHYSEYVILVSSNEFEELLLENAGFNLLEINPSEIDANWRDIC